MSRSHPGTLLTCMSGACHDVHMSDDNDAGNKRGKGVSKSKAIDRTREERSAAASRAASQRWLKETHSGVLRLGDGIPCSVLSNGQRVFSMNGLTRALGHGGKGGLAPKGETQKLPPMLAAANMRPFIDDELRRALVSPIKYRSIHGGRTALGYEASVLHRICDAILVARAAGVLRETQQQLAAQAELLLRGFARVGLIALIDEATGYQAERQRDELFKILKAYISKELLPWARKFPDEFFQQIYRLYGWNYEPGNTQRPQYVGKFINKYVYSRLPQGVLDELRRRNPPVNGKGRRHKHFQFLTQHTGHPHLDKQIVAVTTAMRLSENPVHFDAQARKLWPKKGDQIELNLPPPPSDEGKGADLDITAVSPSERAMQVLRKGSAGTRTLAEKVYGDGSETTMGKTRKLLSRLKDEGRVESPARGVWQLSDTTA